LLAACEVQATPPSILEVAKKKIERLLTIFLSLLHPQLPPTLLLPPRQLPHMCAFVVISGSSSNLSSPTMGHYSIFAGIDLKNDFHQLRVTEQTSRMLSIVTPWGHCQSPFMQESIPIAIFRFHQAVVTIFEDFLDWMIVIIDNLLILAHDYHDLYDKIVLVVRRCIKHNVFRKLEISFLDVK